MKKNARTYPQHIAQTSLCRGVVFLCWLLVSGLTHAETTNVAGALVKETNPGLQPHGGNWRLEKTARVALPLKAGMNHIQIYCSGLEQGDLAVDCLDLQPQYS